MMKTAASIDLGSYTARLLVARVREGQIIESVARERIYVHIGNDPSLLDSRLLSNAAQSRAIEALRKLSEQALLLGANAIQAVATGVIRSAGNREQFIDQIKKETGLNVRLISGIEEASLTAKGALWALKGLGPPLGVFDLGGGSTEFFFQQDQESEQRLLSIPLGAAVLTERFLRKDPPDPRELSELEEAIKNILENAEFPFKEEVIRGLSLVGTGGTVTSIAAMKQNVPLPEISPENLNGTQINSSQIEEIFDKIKQCPFSERAILPGLDRNRAIVIIAGTLCVLLIMQHLQVDRLYVSLSDLLEGVLLDFLENFRVVEETKI